MSKQIKALKTAIDSLERLQAAFMLYDDWKGVDIYESTMNGINACKEALEDADNKEIGEYEIKAMLDDIEWYQHEQRKLIDRIIELEKKVLKESKFDSLSS